MALDSELNVLSEAKDVAFQLHSDLFSQCTGQLGSGQFEDTQTTLNDWQKITTTNADLRKSGAKINSQLLSFYVDRKPDLAVVWPWPLCDND